MEKYVVETGAKFLDIVEKHDPTVIKRLNEHNITPLSYGMAWMITLLSQSNSFGLKNVITIWDYLFADETKFEFFDYICAALVLSVREEIVNGDMCEAQVSL